MGSNPKDWTRDGNINFDTWIGTSALPTLSGELSASLTCTWPVGVVTVDSSAWTRAWPAISLALEWSWGGVGVGEAGRGGEGLGWGDIG